MSAARTVWHGEGTVLSFFFFLHVAGIKGSKCIVNISWTPHSAFCPEGSQRLYIRDHSPTAGAQQPLGLRQLLFCTSSAPQHCFKNGKWRETYPWEMMNTYLFEETCTQHRHATCIQDMQPTVSQSESVQHNPVQRMHRTGRALHWHQEETWCIPACSHEFLCALYTPCPRPSAGSGTG